jgi:hypothetical protein
MLMDFVTHEPLKLFKKVAELTIPFEAEAEDYIGGGDLMAEEAGIKTYKSDMTLQLKQYDREMYAYLSSAVVTIGAAEPSGYVSAAAIPPTAVYSVGATNTISSTVTGIASIAVSNVANLKTGKYIIKAASATTIYFMPCSDFEFGGAFTAGTQVNFATNALGTDIANRQLMVTGTAPFTFSVSNGAQTVLTGFGLTITGGSAVAMTPGDTAEIEVRAANIENDQIILGKAEMMIPKRYAMLATMDSKATGEVIYVFAPKVMPLGFNIPLKQKAWSDAAPKLKMLHYTNESEDFACKIYRSQRLPV